MKRNLSCDDMISDFIAYFIMQASASNKTNNKCSLPFISNVSENLLEYYYNNVPTIKKEMLLRLEPFL